MDAFALAMWAIWATLLAIVVSSAYQQLARWCRRLPWVRLPRPVQTLSATMLGTVAAGTTVVAASPPAVAHPPQATAIDLTDRLALAGLPHIQAPAAPPHTPTTHPAVWPTVGSAAPGVGQQARTVTVARGDTLWGLAGSWLGQHSRWPQLYRLNAARYDQHGRMHGGDHIEPGWVLTLPDDATPPAGARPSDPPPASPTVDPGGNQPVVPSPTTDPPAPTPSATPPAAASATAAGVRQGRPDTTPLGQVNASPVTPSPALAPVRDSSAASRPRGATLSTGSWVDLGLAMAIAAAVALVWKHRQRRHTPRPPSATLRLDEPETTPMPDVVNQIRRDLRRLQAGNDDGAALVEAPGRSRTMKDDSRPAITEDAEGDEDGPSFDAGDTTRGPVVPALGGPLSALWPPAGLGLTGPGAQAAARGFLAAALAAGALDDPDARTWVITPSTTAATLLGAAALTLPGTPRLTITAGLDEALRILEAQTLHRTRLVHDHDVDDVAALREADPFEEPLPPILLLADATARPERSRVAALLAQGQRLDIHGVLLGVWPDGDTVTVAADGTTTAGDDDPARHGSHPVDIARLAVLNRQETADLIVTLAESHTGRRPAAQPIEPTPAGVAPTTDVPPVMAQPTPTSADHEPPVVAEAADPPDAAADGHDRVMTSTAGSPPAPPDRDEPAPLDTDDRAAGTGAEHDGEPAGDPATAHHPAGVSAGQVEVRVLGTFGIVDADAQRSMRGKSQELLVYLAVRDGDAHTDAILDDLMPDAPATKAPHRLHTYVSDLRALMRHNGGSGSYLTHPRGRYVLNKDTIDVDLWRMRAAIREADQATDPATRIAALRRAVAAYGGPLAWGCDYEWIEPYRETIRREALDAHLALADALTDQPTEQVTILDSAIQLNPYTEEVYQAAMRARAALGHLDAIRTLRRTLTRRLAEIDAEPADETVALADRLVAGLQRAGARPGFRAGEGA